MDYKKGTLFIVGTPIGNLSDITFRAITILQQVDYILAEDTRVTHKLLSHYQIKKPVIRCDEYAKISLFKNIENDLKKNKSIAYVSDAGTPNLADPGSKLIGFILNNSPHIPIVPIPGVSALTTLLSVASVSGNNFCFLGYPPHKKGRKNFFLNALKNSIRPLIFFESPHRIVKTLKELNEVCAVKEPLLIGRELTKFHEEIFRGTFEKAIEHFSREKQRGEFIFLIY